MNALIVEGGALRSVFSAGLLDAFMSRKFYPFDFAIGVSAGAANLLMYLNRRQGKALQLYQQLSQQAEFINFSRFVSGGHLLDLDLLFSDQYQFADLRLQQTGSLLITMTDVISGQAHYVDAAEPDFLDALKASMSLPVLYRHFPLYRGQPMTDGGVADGIPLAQAISRGANRVMVIRSRHHNYRKKDSLWHRAIRWRCRQHKALVEVMQQRGALHERHKQLIRNPPGSGRVIDMANTNLLSNIILDYHLWRVAPCATIYNMIKGFRHKGLKRFFETGSKKGIQVDHVRRLSQLLAALDEAEVVDDMDQPGWNLHPLKGDMDGNWSVKVSANWRVTFIFEDGNAYVVDYQDYH